MSARGAAFFDLDRTLLAGGSGPVISAAMRAVGLIEREVPGEKVMFGIFNAIGETLPAMALARQGARMAKGRKRDTMRDAARVAAPTLVELMQPYAADVIESHRAAGRPVVLATTTPFDMIEPFAEAVGFDAVLATRYGVNADGTYDGTLTGHFVWSAGKLAAVRDWSTSNGIDLAASYAYSDSVFDSPLLGAVGHPYAVNPDPRMVVMAALRRWPTMSFATAPESNGDRDTAGRDDAATGFNLQQLALAFTNPLLVPYARFEFARADLVPRSGPAILVANHRSYFDVAAMAMLLARSGRTARFLGKKEVFDAPVIGQLAKAMGGIRVDRGTGSDEPLRAAADALEQGDVVALMPQGTIPRGKEFFNPVLKGRWGAARLAAQTGAPVIPVGLWGTERVWPRSSRLPNFLNVVDPPLIQIRVGSPVRIRGRSADADTKAMMKAIVALLPQEAREKRVPTAVEIAAALPPGHSADRTSEPKRRPGTD